MSDPRTGTGRLEPAATPARAVERPLDGLERRYWLMAKVAPLSPSFVARVRGDVRPEHLRAALDAAQARHWLLRVRVDERADGPWFVEGAPPLPLRVVARRGEDAWLGVLEEELNAPSPTHPGPLWKATLVRGDGVAELLLVYHHIAGDGLASADLARELLRDAARAAAGEPLDRAPRPPLAPVGALLPPSARGPAARALLEREVARFEELKARGPPVRMTVETPAPPGRRRNLLVHRALDAAETAALAAAAKGRGVTVHSVLCAAVLQAAAADAGVAGRALLGCSTPANLRAQLARPVGEGLGWYAFGLPLFQEAGPAVPFWDLARRLRDELHEPGLAARRLAVLGFIDDAVPRTPDAAAAEAQGAEDFGLTTVSVTNLGRVEPFAPGGGWVVEEASFTGPQNIGGPIVGLAAMTYGGRLTLTFSHPDPLIGRPRAARFADEVVARLRAAGRDQAPVG